MRLAVTGGGGQLACSLRELARAHGVEVVLLARPRFDLADPAAIERSIASLEVDALINAAAYTAVDRAEADADAAFEINARGAERVALACASRDIPLIHISTDYVFDGTKLEPYVETDAVRPLSVYGESKCEGEQRIVAAWSKHIILRTAWVHSPFGTNFVKTMLRLATAGAEISVVNDQRGGPTYALHLAKAILGVAARIAAAPQRAAYGTYHCTNLGEASWYDVAIATFEESRALGGPFAAVRPIPSSEYPVAASRPQNSRLNTDKLTRNFDVQLPDWRTGLRACVARLVAPGPPPK